MARYKKELTKIHRKKVKKAKEKVRLYLKGELPYEKLTQRAKRFLEKHKAHQQKPS